MEEVDVTKQLHCDELPPTPSKRHSPFSSTRSKIPVKVAASASEKNKSQTDATTGKLGDAKSVTDEKSIRDRSSMSVPIRNRCCSCAANFPDYPAPSSSRGSEGPKTSTISLPPPERSPRSKGAGESQSGAKQENNGAVLDDVEEKPEDQPTRTVSPRPKSPTTHRKRSLERKKNEDKSRERSASFRPVTPGTLMVRPFNAVLGFRTPTYEEIYYRKKALSERGANHHHHSHSSHYPHSSRFNNYSGACGAHFHAEQRAVYTKIVTETNYEYDDEDASSMTGSCHEKRAKPKTFGSGSNKSVSKVPPRSSKPRKADEMMTKGKNTPQQTQVSAIKSKISATPSPPAPQLPKEKEFSEISVQTSCCCEQSCRKCKELKDSLYQTQATLRYLTEMLVLKDNALQAPSGADKEKQSSKEKSDEAAHAPNSTITPSFDLDEFIRKYFRNLLYSSSSNSSSSSLSKENNNESNPFTPLQLQHVAISARDCMAQVIRQKLKHAEGVLKQKYDMLMTLRATSEEPMDEDLYISLLDSYRRFVRFIYHYLKDSMRHVEQFELTYVSPQPPPTMTQRKSRQRPVYSQEQVVTIRGEKYAAVVIPIRKMETQ